MKQLLCITLIFVLFACSKDNSNPQSGSSTTGVSGSLARFAVTNEHLYAVTNSGLKVFDVSNSENPIEGREIPLGFGIETIFPKGNNLFIGTQTGMRIFDASKPETPVQLSDYRHVRSCDPVVANDKYAFVTLRTEETQCTRGVNEL